MPKKIYSDDERMPWDRQPGESAEAFQAFAIYRDQLDKSEDQDIKRSIRQVARHLDKSTTLIGRWSSRWGWVERVDAYDKYRDRIKQDKAIKEYQKMVERHTKIAMSIQEKAIRALNNITEEDLTPSVLLAYLTKATEIERANRMSAAGIDEASQMDVDVEIVIEDSRSAED